MASSIARHAVVEITLPRDHNAR